jgi:hypothetical protein
MMPRNKKIIPSNCEDQLHEAVEGLYDTFSRYKLAQHVEGCPCCVTEADGAMIHSAPLRQLGAEKLSEFAHSSMTTWGSVDDLRHFLPRLFELVANHEDRRLVDLEILFGKLAYGHWKTWPTAEQQAIVQFLHAMWRSVLSRFPQPDRNVDAYLCAIGQAEDDIRMYLDEWNVAGSAPAACNFASFVHWNTALIPARRLTRWKLSNPFWPGRDGTEEQVTTWLRAPERIAALEEAFFCFAMNDPNLAETLSDGCNRLSWLQLTIPISEFLGSK